MINQRVVFSKTFEWPIAQDWCVIFISNVIRKRPKRLSDAGLKIEEVAREGTLRVREENGYRCVPCLEIVKWWILTCMYLLPSTFETDTNYKRVKCMYVLQVRLYCLCTENITACTYLCCMYCNTYWKVVVYIYICTANFTSCTASFEYYKHATYIHTQFFL